MSKLKPPHTILYYNLVWNSIRNHKLWLSDKQELDGEYYSGEVRLRKSNIMLKLYGNISEYSGELFGENIRDVKVYRNIPLIKSNLQKCIRQGLVDKAIVTAYNFILIKPWDFLRRLLIIMVEDVSITDNMDFIMWLMIGFPNFKWTDEITRYLLLTVYSLCVSKKTLIINDLSYNNISKTQFETAIHSKILRPILIRYEYGGLRGDMRMLRNILLDNNDFNNSIIKVSRKKIVLNRNICETDFIKSSIDFHITKKMISYIVDKSPIKDEELIKNLIWYNSSGINYRKPAKIYQKDNWELIKPCVKDFYKIYKIW